jgi:hypothetical protein
MAGQEYDRQRAAALAKHVLKLQSADAGHPHVEQDTAFCGGIVRIEERLSRGEGDSTDASHRYVTRFVHDEALQAVAARTTAAHMRL